MRQVKKSAKYYDGAILRNPQTGQWALKLAGTTKHILLSEVPEWMTGKNYPKGQKINAAIFGTKLSSVKPVSGNYKVKFVGFAAKEGEDPTPKLTNVWQGQKELVCYALFEMLDEGWNGNTISIRLDYYRFELDHASGETVVGGKSKGANLLASLMNSIGFEETPPKWSSNMLPEIAERADKDRVLTVTFVPGNTGGGWAVAFDHEEISAWEEGEDDVPWEEGADLQEWNTEEEESSEDEMEGMV